MGPHLWRRGYFQARLLMKLLCVVAEKEAEAKQAQGYHPRDFWKVHFLSLRQSYLLLTNSLDR